MDGCLVHLLAAAEPVKLESHAAIAALKALGAHVVMKKG